MMVTDTLVVCLSDSVTLVILVGKVMSHTGVQQAAQSCDLEDDWLLAADKTCVSVCALASSLKH